MRYSGPVGHLAADCARVSGERVRHRFLPGKLAGVLGNHGACVIAEPGEVKVRGARTGEPAWDAV